MGCPVAPAPLAICLEFVVTPGQATTQTVTCGACTEAPYYDPATGAFHFFQTMLVTSIVIQDDLSILATYALP